jgi:hypothetical protein
MSIKRGSSLVEALLSVFLMVLLTPLFIQVLSLLLNFPDTFIKRQNDIGLLQLRRILSLGHSHKLSHESLCMNYRDEETCFELFEDKLRQHPGTQYYMVGLEHVSFKKEGKWIVLVIETREESHAFGLLYVE